MNNRLLSYLSTRSLIIR